jgi:hypothetical protein
LNVPELQRTDVGVEDEKEVKQEKRGQERIHSAAALKV